MRYTVHMTASAMQALRAIEQPVASYVHAAIRALASDPRPAGCEEIGVNTYRISEWGHLVEYEVLDREIIIRVIFVL